MKTSESIGLTDLEVTETEFKVLKATLDWLRKYEYSELKLVRHADKIHTFITEKDRYSIENADFS